MRDPRSTVRSLQSILVVVMLTSGLLATTLATPAASGALVPAEICDNCVDDNGDTLVDRADPMCIAPANGGNAGLGDESAAKAALKCQKAIEKASTKFGLARLSRLDKCVNLAFACVQTKNGDQACLAKAKTACDKQLANLATDETKLRAALAKPCDESQGAKVPFADVLAVTGLGYMAEEDGTPAFRPCAHTFSSISDVADCIVTRHQCSPERILLAAAPRAVEMLTALGHTPATEFPCLVDTLTNSNSDGGGTALADAATQKTAVKCQAAIGKAAIAFATVGANVIHKCVNDATTCVQMTDASARDACQQTDGPKCQAAIDTLRKSKLQSLFSGVEMKCGPLTLADIDSSAGLGFGATPTRCAQVPPNHPSSDPRILELQCIVTRHFCEDVHMLERQVPRLREYSTFFGITLNE